LIDKLRDAGIALAAVRKATTQKLLTD